MPDIDKYENSANGNIIIGYYPSGVSAALSEFLEAHGYGVYICDSFDSLMSIEVTNLRMVVMDLSSDDDSVCHAIEMIRQMTVRPTVPVLVSSEYPDTEKIVSALNAGAIDYIIRPYSNQELLMRVRTILSLTQE